MNDLIDRLATLRSAATDPGAQTDAVAADLQRGRRALARRRKVRGATSGIAALALAGTAGAMVVNQSATDPGVRLVTYEGSQPAGFTVATVPAGYVLQGSTPYSLDIARPGDRSSLDDFQNKLVVTVEAKSNTPAPQAGAAARAKLRAMQRHPGVKVSRHDDTYTFTFPNGTVLRQRVPHGTQPTFDGGSKGTTESPYRIPEAFRIDGDKATVKTNSEGAKILRYTYGEATVTVQMWPTLGLSDTQLRTFADGITVTDEAMASRG